MDKMVNKKTKPVESKKEVVSDEESSKAAKAQFKRMLEKEVEESK